MLTATEQAEQGAMKLGDEQAHACRVCGHSIELAESIARADGNLKAIEEPLEFACKVLKQHFPQFSVRLDCAQLRSDTDKLKKTAAEAEKKARLLGGGSLKTRVEISFGGCGSSFESTL